MSDRDKTIIEYRQIRDEMRGISPQLSIYKDLEKQVNVLLEKLGGIRDGEKLHIPRATAILNGVRVKIRYPNQIPRPICKFEGCEKQGNSRGRDHYGNQKYDKYCGEHVTRAKRERKKRLKQENV